jgi:hypothetical protein
MRIQPTIQAATASITLSNHQPMNKLRKLKGEGDFMHLITLLEKAESFAMNFCGGYSTDFNSSQAFKNALHDSIKKLRRGDFSQVIDLKKWFTPASAWEQIIGDDGLKLQGEIINKLTEVIETDLFSRIRKRI